MNRTLIPWVKNPDGTQGYTWNPITGCLNHVNGMCKGGNFPCYAYRLAITRLRERYLANPNIAPTVSGWEMKSVVIGEDRHNLDARYLDPFYPRFWPERLEPIGLTGGSKRPHSYGYLKCYKDHKPKGIFVCDMSDLFGVGIPEKWTNQVLDVIKKCPQHRFYLLTKQPQNLIKWSPFPENCWVGVTATNRVMYVNALRYLKDVRVRIRYISFEPLLSAIGMGDNWEMEGYPKRLNDSLMLQLSGINWVIIGAQTKPLKHPPFEYVEEIVNAADRAGIPVFIKPPLCDVMNYHRQEIPKANFMKIVEKEVGK